MKNIKKWLVLTLIVVLAMSMALTACGKKEEGGSEGSSDSGSAQTLEDAIQTANENFSKIESATYAMEMEIGMEVMGMNMDIKSVSDIEYTANPMLAHVNTTSDMGDFGQMTSETYAEEEDGKIAVYSGMDYGDGEVTWFKTLEDAGMTSAQQYNAQSNLDLFVKNAGSFTEAGEDTVDGKKATKYDGVITGDAIYEVVVGSGMGQEIGLGATDLDYAELFKDAGDIPVSIWIDENNMPLQYEMDMTEALKTVMNKAIAAEMGTTEDGESAEVTFEITAAKTLMKITGTNNVDSLSIPDEVKNAAEEISMDDLENLELEGLETIEEEAEGN